MFNTQSNSHSFLHLTPNVRGCLPIRQINLESKTKQGTIK